MALPDQRLQELHHNMEEALFREYTLDAASHGPDDDVWNLDPEDRPYPLVERDQPNRRLEELERRYGLLDQELQRRSPDLASRELVAEREPTSGEIDAMLADPFVAGSEAEHAYYWENGGEFPGDDLADEEIDELDAEEIEAEDRPVNETITYMASTADGADIQGEITVPHVVRRRLAEQLAEADAVASSPTSEVTDVEVISHLDTEGREISAWQLFDEQTGVISEETARSAFSPADAAAVWNADTRPSNTIETIDGAIAGHEASAEHPWRRIPADESATDDPLTETVPTSRSEFSAQAVAEPPGTAWPEPGSSRQPPRVAAASFPIPPSTAVAPPSPTAISDGARPHPRRSRRSQ
ncbi:hypothetical protein WEI85_07685 [Actinomycetes bacterium KLBMP 9797]